MENVGKNVGKSDDTFHQTILTAQTLLTQHPEWIKRYAEYATIITQNLDEIKARKTRFKEWSPLHLYMTVGEAKGTMKFSLRYRGQDVAKISAGPNIKISTAEFDERNKRDFGCDVQLNDCGWRSADARRFRQHFANAGERTSNSRKSNEEHRLESLLLSEFTKRKREEKCIVNIQPVKIAGINRFQMPTPLKASNTNQIGYANANGGGIDIISRIGRGHATRLCIMEVKDEYTDPAKTIQQGLAYATFIRELLRSESGNYWWKILGFNRKLPQTLDIYVVCVMPNQAGCDVSFKGKVLEAGEGDAFHLHYMYFKEEDNQILDIQCSLPQCQLT